jgi:hypothetical protein
MTFDQGCRGTVALVAAYAVALNALLSVAAVVKPAAAADAWHRNVCTADRTERAGDAPERQDATCSAICATLASISDGAMDRVDGIGACRPDGRRPQPVVAADAIVRGDATAAYRSRAPPRA